MGSGQVMQGFEGHVKELLAFILMAMWSHCFEQGSDWSFVNLTLAALWRTGLPRPTVSTGRTLGIYWGDQDQMMEMDLGGDNGNGERYRNLRNV